MPARSQPALLELSRRERQIMDALYQLGRASASELQARISDAPGNSTMRTLLRVLERKGQVRHIEEHLRYVYIPTVPRDTARRSALHRLLRTFFDGSAKQAAAAFLDPAAFKLSKDDLDELARMINRARKEKK